ncbi:MAG: tetratricopeptide repeat protein [Polyangiaceae bacterium]
MNTESSPRPVRPGLLLACVLVAVLVSYIPVLGGPFVWDDQRLIEQSVLVRELRPLSEYLGRGFWQADDLQVSRKYYRPLSILSLALDEKIYNDNPGGFHLTNLLLHVLSTALLFRLLRERGAKAAGAALGSALWALHPRLTEAVAWISGRTDVLATLFVLGALLFQRRTSGPARALTALFLLLGLLSKEVALAGVAFVLVSELFGKGGPRARALRCVPTAIALLVYAGFRMHALGAAQETTPVLSVAQRLSAAAAALGHYAVMTLNPWFPNVQIGRLAQPAPSFVALGCVLAVAFIVWLVHLLRKPELPTLAALALTATALLLVLHLIPLPLNVLAADRFLYSPLLGLTLLLTPTIEAHARVRLAAGLAGVLAASFAAVTFSRATTWSDEVSLWSSAVREVAGESSVPSIELGRVYARAGLFPEALAVYAKAVEVNDTSRPIALNNISTVLARGGHYAEALSVLSPVGREYPNVPLFALNLALFESYLGHFELAHRHLDHALALFPEYGQGQALAKRLPALELERHKLAASSTAMAAERARLLQDLGLGAEALAEWRLALQNPNIPRQDVEDTLWFALHQGDLANIAAIDDVYRTRFPNDRDPRLDLVYETHADLVRRLQAAWGTLGIALAPQ